MSNKASANFEAYQTDVRSGLFIGLSTPAEKYVVVYKNGRFLGHGESVRDVQKVLSPGYRGVSYFTISPASATFRLSA